MKALSVKQPWANLIAGGHKTIETRTWATKYRGELLICASKTVDTFMAEILSFTAPVIGISPIGQALCIVDLVDCRPIVKADSPAAWCPAELGSFAWVLENVRPIKPFPVKGQLGIFEVEYEGK